MTKIDDIKINTGGLMRCCIATITNIPEGTEISEWDLIDCEYEKKPTMVMFDNIIQWVEASTILASKKT